MDILSYVLSILGLISMLSASLVKGKDMRLILALVFAGNFLMALSYLVNGSGLNGAASCFVGSAQTLVNFFFQRKNKDVPIWLVIIYGVSFVTVNILVSGFNLFSIIAIIACIAFVFGIIQNNGAKYRFWTVLNTVLWCVYDIVTTSYAALITHVIMLIFTVAGMIIHDRKVAK